MQILHRINKRIYEHLPCMSQIAIKAEDRKMEEYEKIELHRIGGELKKEKIQHTAKLCSQDHRTHVWP